MPNTPPAPDAPQLPPDDAQLQSIWGQPAEPPTDYAPPTDWMTQADEWLEREKAVTKSAEVEHSDPCAVLRHYWGYDNFRGIQREIIDSLLAGHDTVGLMPTGGGKSITFQVPALMLEGVCIVITPLIALMKDQVTHLRAKGIRATYIHAGLSVDEIVREFDNVVLGDYKFLYISPERVHSDLFRIKLQYMRVSFIAVDEAHCISQWGYDFRPSYLQLSVLRELLPNTPILALTATATSTVLDDIQTQLGFRQKRVFRMSFARPNIAYRVLNSESKFDDLLALLAAHEGSAIVYTRSRGGTRDNALLLAQHGVSATYYHAGLPQVDKDARQEAWQHDKIRVMVSTNAFGMGIDKPDVRLVVHLDLPDSIEAYFQEAGRAGRDGQPATAVLLFNQRDHRIMAGRISQTFPTKEAVRNIYDDLSYYFQVGVGSSEGAVFEIDLDDFCRKFRHFPLTVVNSLTILERAGYMAYADEDETRSRLLMLMRRDALYHFRSSQPLDDRVLTAVLRLYGGLFSDYVFIDEHQLAKETDSTPDAVYQTLLGLTRARVLHYIPRRAVSRITYLMRRVPGSRVALTPEIYEKRRNQYEKRINGMINYCTDSTTCRSVQLLRYFDDDSGQPCGHCDVCDSNAPLSLGDKALRQHILERLADHRPHAAAEFRFAGADAARAGQLLQSLTDEGRLHFSHGTFTLIE